MAWSIETALALGFLPVVSSDSEKYLEIAKEYGANTLLRDSGYAEDETSMWMVLKQELPRLGVADDETVILFQPTSPFRSVDSVKKALNVFTDEMDSIISVSEVPAEYHPEEVFVRKAFGWTMANGLPISERKTRRQEYFEAAHPNGQFYIFRGKNLKTPSFYGRNPQVIYTKNAPNINDEESWKAAEEYMKTYDENHR